MLITFFMTATVDVNDVSMTAIGDVNDVFLEVMSS